MKRFGSYWSAGWLLLVVVLAAGCAMSPGGGMGDGGGMTGGGHQH